MLNVTNCPCTGVNLDKLIQPAILMILAQETLHGYMIIEKMAQTPMFQGMKPDASGVYRYLKLMEERKLIISSWNIENAASAKRIYQLTDEGYQCLYEWKKALAEYHYHIGLLVEEIGRVLALEECK